MDVNELKELAKSMGYNIIKIKTKEKLLPCTCGCNRRSHWDVYANGVWYITLKCNNCDREARGKTEAEAIHNWNEMIWGEQNGCNNTES